MPIEIRELNIKVSVGGKAEETNDSAAKGENSEVLEKEALVSEIIEQVLEILQNQRER